MRLTRGPSWRWRWTSSAPAPIGGRRIRIPAIVDHDTHRFLALADARAKIAAWRRDHDKSRHAAAASKIAVE